MLWNARSEHPSGPSEMRGLKPSSQQLHPDVSRLGHHSRLSRPHLWVLRKGSLLLCGPDYHLIPAKSSWFFLFLPDHCAKVVSISHHPPTHSGPRTLHPESTQWPYKALTDASPLTGVKAPQTQTALDTGLLYQQSSSHRNAAPSVTLDVATLGQGVC